MRRRNFIATNRTPAPFAPSEITPGRFGAVPRHYIRCTQDRAIPLTGQDHMIATVDAAIGGKTTTHTLESSHSPFLSQPAALSKILIDIAAPIPGGTERGSARSRHMNTDEFEDRLKALRPRLHRYCARMTGSAVNGEDVFQDALVKALHARAQGAEVDNLEGWLFRIAHNASLDFLREQVPEHGRSAHRRRRGGAHTRGGHRRDRLSDVSATA